jgi:hypothetical protein
MQTGRRRIETIVNHLEVPFSTAKTTTPMSANKTLASNGNIVQPL